ncbi:MAG: TonB-dependent receptor plug domain-containing protein, partial [Chitinophagaceae bacterium]
MQKKLTFFSKMLLIAALSLLTVQAFAQQQEVAGVVTDAANGDPLIGVTISTKNGTVGTVTGTTGQFSLDITRGDTLRVSLLGYETRNIVYAHQKTLEIKLSQSSKVLNQLVVVGYGTQKRSELSGAVATLSEKVIEHANTSNVGTALEGQLPGLLIQQSTGQPGSSPSITFRGGTTFGGSGTPLIIVDGIIVPSLYGLDMNDIKSITVLKDAASTAIYGARASNGVILITTKTGGVPKVTYTIRETRNLPPANPMDYLTASQYIHWNRYGLGNRWQADVADGNANAARNDMNQLFGGWGWAINSGWTNPEGLYTTQLVTNANRHWIGQPGWNVMTDPNPFKP